MTTFTKASNTLCIILNWNTSDETAGCLESIAANNTDFDTVVIDNGSREDEVQRMRSIAACHSRVTLVENPHNIGFARGMNQGMHIARKQGYEFVLLLNNDTTLAPDCVGLLHAEMAQNERVAIAGPQIFFMNSQRVWHTAGTIQPWLAKANGLALQGETTVRTDGFDFLTGACMLIRMNALDEIGLFDPQYFAYLEDMDLCKRVQASGWKLLYHPGAHMWHSVSQSSGGSSFSPITLFLRTRNRILFQKKYASLMQKIFFFLYHSAFVDAFTLYGLLTFKPAISAAVIKGYISGYFSATLPLNQTFPHYTQYGWETNGTLAPENENDASTNDTK